MGAPDSGGKRGLLKPEKRLQWQGTAAPASKGAPAAKARPVPRPPRPAGLPSNALSPAEFTMEQVQKMAASRGIPVEKLLAQMVQQYLKEDLSEE